MRGQALVVVVFFLVGLLVMAGLAIDGGTMFLERRRMQNAADAASLAGTRMLAAYICDPASASDQAIWDEVVRYAEENGVQDGQNAVTAEYIQFDADGNVISFSPQVWVGPRDGLLVPTGASGVSAVTGITRTTSLMTLVGIAEANVSAYGLAITAPPRYGGGMRPFGIPLQLAQTLTPNDPANNSFSVDFDNNGGTIDWVGANPEDHRGWMNFGYMFNASENPSFPRANPAFDNVSRSGNAHILAEWMANGWDGTIYTGDYIHAQPGAVASVVCAAPEGAAFYVPVYDAIPVCDPDIPAPKPACPVAGGGYMYHIVGFAGVEITACNQGQKHIEARLVDMIMGEGVPNPRGAVGFGEPGACDLHSMAIALWE
jgi:hypothetical protein